MCGGGGAAEGGGGGGVRDSWNGGYTPDCDK